MNNHICVYCNNEDDDDGFYDDSDELIPLPCNHCNTQQNKYIHRICLNNFCLDHNCVRCPACGNDTLHNVFFKTNYWKTIVKFVLIIVQPILYSIHFYYLQNY